MVYVYNRYRQEYLEYCCREWWMIHRYVCLRHVRTYQERRRWFKDIEEECTWRKGRRNTHYLDPWDYGMEKYPSCYTSKSWKKLNRVKYQWEKINSKTFY